MSLPVLLPNRVPTSIAVAWLGGLTFILFFTMGHARVLACDDGTAVPDADNNSGLVADCKVLLGLRDELAGTGSLNWDADLAISDWQGITISGSPSRVSALKLRESQLTGDIPRKLAQLQRLEQLSLGENQLTGPIPKELAQVSHLQYLSLGQNQLTGPIPPELGQLSQLVGLRLDHNRLTGPIPAELGQLYGLALLHLDHNYLTGPIPPELGQLFQLLYLHLDHNRLTGPIPIELGELYRLAALHLDHNRLTGPIPAVLGQLSELLYLHLQHNQLTGAFPIELGQLSSLWQFSFRGNRLTGPVPPELGHLPDLYVLNLDARWVGPDRIKVTWDAPGDPTAVYEYRLRGFDFEVLVGSTEIPKTMLRPGKGVTIEWTLTGLPTEVAYKSIEIRASNRNGSSPTTSAEVRSFRPPGDTDQERYPPPYCLSLWDGDPCAIAAVLPHVFMGPLGVNTAEAEILVTNRDPDPQSCEMALLFHRGSSVAPEILFDGRPIEGNLFQATVPRGGARILTLTADSEELVVGAVSVFVRSPCSVGSLRAQGRYLVENQVDGGIQEVFSVSGQSPREWLGDGDCQDITGVFGTGRDLGFASVSAEPQRTAPAGTRLHYRAFDLKGKPTAESPGSLEITGEHTASFPWKFQDPTILEMCLDVPEENSDFEISTIAIGIVQKGENVQWSDEIFTPIDSQEVPSALSDPSP